LNYARSLKDATFEISKDYDVNPAKEMQGLVAVCKLGSVGRAGRLGMNKLSEHHKMRLPSDWATFFC
jgi:hypothetical protein